MTAGVVQLELLTITDITGPRVWHHHRDVPQDEPGLTIRDDHGLRARNVSPGRWLWTTQPACDGTYLDREHWVSGDPWYWPAYLWFPVAELPEVAA
jgi:hypothetical protein